MIKRNKEYCQWPWNQVYWISFEDNHVHVPTYINNKYIDKILKYMALLLGVLFPKFLEHHTLLIHYFTHIDHAMFEAEGLFHVLIMSTRELMPTYWHKFPPTLWEANVISFLFASKDIDEYKMPSKYSKKLALHISSMSESYANPCDQICTNDVVNPTHNAHNDVALATHGFKSKTCHVHIHDLFDGDKYQKIPLHSQFFFNSSTH